MQAVGPGLDGEAAVGDRDAVLAPNGAFGGTDLVDAAGDGHLVLAHDAVARGGGDDQLAGAVEGDVVLGEDHGVHVVVVDLDEAAAVGEGVDGALGKGLEDLIRLDDVDGREGLGVNRHVVQHQLDLVVLVRVDDDAAVFQRAGENVGARRGDGDGAAGDLHAVRGSGNAGAVQGDENRFGSIIVTGQIPI